MNRITAAIDRQKTTIANRGLTAAETAELSKKLDLDFGDYCYFQELKSVMTGGVLSIAEAMSVYGYLGNTPEHFNKQPLEVKCILTKVFQELLERVR